MRWSKLMFAKIFFYFLFLWEGDKNLLWRLIVLTEVDFRQEEQHKPNRLTEGYKTKPKAEPIGNLVGFHTKRNQKLDL